MSDMEPAEQKVIADLSGYVGPIEGEAVPATQDLADTVDELNGTLADLGGTADDTGASLGEAASGAAELAEGAGRARDDVAGLAAAAGDASGQVDELSGAEDAATASSETLAEAMARFRDRVYETNPGIDEATASLLAESAAMQALGLSAEETAGTINRTEDYEALRNALFDLSAGEAIVVGRNSDLTLGFRGLSDDAARASTALRDAGDAAKVTFAGIREAGIAADESLLAAGSAIEDYHAKLTGLADTLAAVEPGLLGGGSAAASAFFGDLAVTGEDATAALESLGPAGEEAAAGLGDTGAQAAAAGAAMPPLAAGIAAVVIAAAPIGAAVATSFAAVGAAAVTVLPEIRQVMNDLSGTGKNIPRTGPVAQAISEIHQLGAAWREVAADSGIQGDFLHGIGQVSQTIESFLFDIQPLARAGATSIGEIVSSLDRVANSQGFTSFVGMLAQDAPAATDAVIHLAGAIGGDLEQVLTALAPQAAADTNAVADLAAQLGGPLATALVATSSGLHGLTEGFSTVEDAAKLLIGPVATLVGGTSHLAMIAESVGSTFGILLGGPIAMVADAGEKFKNMVDPAHAAAGAAKSVGTSVQSAGIAVAAQGPHLSKYQQDMAGAANEANSLATRVTDLTNALNLESGATDTALGNIVTFHQGLATLSTDMQNSGDQAGYLTKAQQATAAELATLDTQARAASEGILQTTGSAAQAAGPLETMRAEMEKLQDPTTAERELLRELNNEIDALHSKQITITMIERLIQQGAGSSGGTTGGPIPRINAGPDAVPVPSMVPSLIGTRAGGTQGPALVNVNVDVSGAGMHMAADPRWLQSLAPVIEEAVLRHAYNNQSAGMHYGGYSRVA